jgi:hypothetical protein
LEPRLAIATRLMDLAVKLTPRSPSRHGWLLFLDPPCGDFWWRRTMFVHQLQLAALPGARRTQPCGRNQQCRPRRCVKAVPRWKNTACGMGAYSYWRVVHLTPIADGMCRWAWRSRRPGEIGHVYLALPFSMTVSRWAEVRVQHSEGRRAGQSGGAPRALPRERPPGGTATTVAIASPPSSAERPPTSMTIAGGCAGELHPVDPYPKSAERRGLSICQAPLSNT